MKLGEAIQRVQSLYSRGVQSDDSRLTPRHIYNVLKGARALLLEQKDTNSQEISQWCYQTLPCVELVPASPYECPCVPPMGCMLLRSKYPLPIPLTGYDGDLIQSVTSLDGTLRIDNTTFATNKYTDGNKYTATKAQKFLFNRYMYITVLKQLRVVQVTMLADDPLEVWAYPSMCADDCPDCCMDLMDREFPLNNSKTDAAIKMASDELITIFTQMRQDKNNDSSDDTAVQTMVHQPNQG